MIELLYTFCHAYFSKIYCVVWSLLGYVAIFFDFEGFGTFGVFNMGDQEELVAALEASRKRVDLVKTSAASAPSDESAKREMLVVLLSWKHLHSRKHEGTWLKVWVSLMRFVVLRHLSRWFVVSQSYWPTSWNMLLNNHQKVSDLVECGLVLCFLIPVFLLGVLQRQSHWCRALRAAENSRKTSVLKGHHLPLFRHH